VFLENLWAPFENSVSYIWRGCHEQCHTQFRHAGALVLIFAGLSIVSYQVTVDFCLLEVIVLTLQLLSLTLALT
jgi:hypothetical protein